jgi:hypothetical protein
MLQNIYSDEALSCSSVFEWFKRFKDGREDLRMIQEAGVPQLLEMQIQSQISVKW